MFLADDETLRDLAAKVRVRPNIEAPARQRGTKVSDKQKVKIKVKDFVSDLRGGMDDPSLIDKYGLSEEMLPKLIDQLLTAGHISEEDLSNRNVLDSTQKVVELFSFPFGSEEHD